jgi:hypothetical protein
MFFELSCEYKPNPRKRNQIHVSFFQHFVLTTLMCFLTSAYAHAQTIYHLNRGNQPVVILDSAECRSFMLKELSIYYQNGFARAHWALDTVFKHSDTTHVKYTLMSGNIIRMDSLFLVNGQFIRPSVLYTMMGWKSQKTFIYEAFEFNLKTIPQLNFIQISKPQYYFTNHTVNTRVEVKSTANNELDGMMGLVNGSGGKSILLGQVKVKWINALRHADEMNIDWQRQAKSTQRLQFSFQIPYCFKSNFGWSMQTDLYKKDSTFFQSKLDLGLQYRFQPQQSLNLQFQRQKSSRLNDVQNSNILHSLFGMEYRQAWSSDHYLLKTHLFAGKGNRQFYSLDSISRSPILKSQLQIELALFIKNIYFQSSLQNWFLSKEANQPIEWYRIGGNQTLRGFQQESIFIRNGQCFQFNLGYGNRTSGRLYLFYDWGLLSLSNEQKRSVYSSFGPGAQLPTAGGNVLIHFGWGQYPQTALQLKNGVFNLSYQVYF